jgi:hypothetical protein
MMTEYRNDSRQHTPFSHFPDVVLVRPRFHSPVSVPSLTNRNALLKYFLKQLRIISLLADFNEMVKGGKHEPLDINDAGCNTGDGLHHFQLG